MILFKMQGYINFGLLKLAFFLVMFGTKDFLKL